MCLPTFTNYGFLHSHHMRKYWFYVKNDFFVRRAQKVTRVGFVLRAKS